MWSNWASLSHPPFDLEYVAWTPIQIYRSRRVFENSPTHLMNLALIFIVCIVLNKKFHETLSYALEKSNFKKTINCFDVLAQCKVSCVKTILSKMKRSGRNDVYYGLITSHKIG